LTYRRVLNVYIVPVCNLSALIAVGLWHLQPVSGISADHTGCAAHRTLKASCAVCGRYREHKLWVKL